MARSFNGTSDQVVMSIGSAGGVNYGTYAAIVRSTSDSVNTRVMYAMRDGAGATNRGALTKASTLKIEARFSGTIASPTITLTVADGWCLIAATKSTGNVAIRFHKYNYGTNTWEHEDGGTSSNITLTYDALHIGHRASDQRWAGDIAAIGLWNFTLTDQEIESLAFSLNNWYSNAPETIWVLDQASTSQPIYDLAGYGANQSTLTGTTVATQSVPGFSYGQDIFFPDLIPGAANPKTETEAQDFSSAHNADATYGTVAVSGGTLNLTFNLGYSGATWTNPYDLTASYLYAKVADFGPILLGDETEAYLFAFVDGSGGADGVYINYYNGRLYCYYRNSGSTTTVASSAMASTACPWWRISESGGTITFSYSTVSSSWTTLGTTATSNVTAGITSMSLELGAGQYGTGETAGTVKWDYLNTAEVITATLNSDLMMIGQGV